MLAIELPCPRELTQWLITNAEREILDNRHWATIAAAKCIVVGIRYSPPCRYSVAVTASGYAKLKRSGMQLYMVRRSKWNAMYGDAIKAFKKAEKTVLEDTEIRL